MQHPDKVRASHPQQSLHLNESKGEEVERLVQIIHVPVMSEGSSNNVAKIKSSHSQLLLVSLQV